MPRITVTADPVSSKSSDAPVLLSESVNSVHLSTEHAAAQLIERLSWAIGDAEDAEGFEGADGWDFSLIRRSAKPATQRQATRRSPAASSRGRVTAKAA
ncbi:MAG TPA: hypothetical protein VNR42_11365 [Solirubrobacteraceae bacterium]|nr:hypothetical protein [Solirubrobacteraceae bacterium]